MPPSAAKRCTTSHSVLPAFRSGSCFQRDEEVPINHPHTARQSIFGIVGKAFNDLQRSANSAFELTQDAVAASVAVQMSNRARATVLDQWEKLTNVATERSSAKARRHTICIRQSGKRQLMAIAVCLVFV